MTGRDRVNARGLQEAMERDGLDAVVALSPENVLYLSGALIITQKLDLARPAAVVFPRDTGRGHPAVVVHGAEEAVTRRDSWISEVRTYLDGFDACLAEVAAVLCERGLERARIGIELDWLPVRRFESLREHLPHANFLGADAALAHARFLKTGPEIEILRRATIVTGEALSGAFAAARPGMSEKELADELGCRLLRGGAEGIWLTLSSGDNMHVRHHLAGDRRIREGDLVLAVGGGSFGGYYSNLARMAAVGHASARRIDRYRWLYETLRLTITHVRPGNTIGGVFAAARAAYERAGHAFSAAAVGHSIGLLVHDWPMLRANDATILKPGMTLQIEHGVPDGEGFRFSIEDLVLVTDSGPETLSDDSCWQELPVIA